jgi:hypothetical protein
MSTELTLDEVYEEKVEEPEVETVEVEAEETVEATEESQEETEVEEAEVETTATKKEEIGTLAGMLDEREKRQAAVKRAEELEAKLAALETPQNDVSVFEDEKGYTEQQDEKVSSKVNEAVLGMSRAYAVREFGEEKVAQAEKWYADEGMKSPHAIDRIHKSDLKFHEAVNLFDEEQARLDTEGLEAKVEARIRAEFEAKYSSEPEEPRKPIKPSLASARSTGKDAVSTTDDFEDILNL